MRVHTDIPTGRGQKALWENLGASKLARPGNCDVWLSTAHSVPFLAHVPTVTLIHDMIPLTHPEYQDRAQSTYLRWALVSAAKRATHVLTNSEATKEEIIRFASVPKNKVTVIPLGPGWDIGPEPVTSKVTIPFSHFLLTLGTIEPRKNLTALFEAFALLDANRELEGWGVVVVGGRGWKDQGILKELDRLGVTEKVHFSGYVEDAQLPDLFAACDAFVFPSLFEGFGMPIIEAMRSGAMVLTSDRGAMKEVGGNAAAYFDPTKPASIADAIRSHAILGTDKSGLVQRGRQRSKEFTWERSADATIQVLRNLVQGARA